MHNMEEEEEEEQEGAAGDGVGISNCFREKRLRQAIKL